MGLDESSTLRDAGPSYERAGTGEPLLLIHGLGSDRHVWDLVMPQLTDTFDVIRVDLPGHGRSPRLALGADASPAGLAQQVAALLDSIDLPTTHVAGSSLGGWIGLELARLGRARSVTALAPAGFWRNGIVPLIAHTNRWLARAVDPIAPALLKVTPLRAVGFWTSSANPSALEPHLAAQATRAQARSSGWAAALAATHPRRCDARDVAESIPVTIVWGDRDRILPAASCQAPEGAPAHARWVRLHDCGHVPMWDAPADAVRLIEETVTSRQRIDRLA